MGVLGELVLHQEPVVFDGVRYLYDSGELETQFAGGVLVGGEEVAEEVGAG